MPTKRTLEEAAKNRSLAAVRGRSLEQALEEFPHGVGSLNGAERFDVLDNWTRVLEDLYAHLPEKAALYGFNPVRAIERLRQQVSDLTDLQFHRELMMLINRLRDAHTQYTGPKSLQSAVATLPFLVESFGPAESPNYIVSKVDRRSVHDSHFQPGVALDFWNGIPFDRAVDLHAEVETGGRPDARRARALDSMTVRALGYLPPPDEKWVIVGYRDRNNKAREIRFNWRAVYPDRDPRASKGYAARRRRAINPAAEAVRRAKKLLFNPDLWRAERAKPAAREASTATGYEDFLTARKVSTPKGEFGYLRIWSFDVDDDQEFLDAATRLLAQLPDRGLIIDLRDNPGGLIWAAERMLQLFTPNRVTPIRFALRATQITAAMAAAPMNQQELGPWAASLACAASTGEPYSNPVPITSVEQCNDVGQCYGGPVVVVVNANTYSCGDLFTAGIVDNRIGPVVCIGEATGAGGANVWMSDDVQAGMRSAGVHLPDLPHGTSFTVAVRRAVRSGDADGMLIEDSGITGQRYFMTLQDVVGHNDDLIEYCAELLAEQPWTRMQVTARGRALTVNTVGLDQIDVYCDGHPAGASIEVRRDGVQRISLPEAATDIEVQGFGESVLRQRRRLQVECARSAAAR